MPALPTCRQIDLLTVMSTCCPVTHTWKKAFAKSNPAWFTPRTLAEASKMVAMLGIAMWMGGHLVQFPVVCRHLPQSTWLFDQPLQAIESTLGRVSRAHSVRFSDGPSCLLMWEVHLV